MSASGHHVKTTVEERILIRGILEEAGFRKPDEIDKLQWQNLGGLKKRWIVFDVKLKSYTSTCFAADQLSLLATAVGLHFEHFCIHWKNDLEISFTRPVKKGEWEEER